MLAIAFVAPLWRSSQKKGRALLLGAIALFMLAIGGGTYFFVGRPYLAERSAQGLNNVHDINGLVPYLITRVRAHPEDVRAWRYLGKRLYGGQRSARCRQGAGESDRADRQGRCRAWMRPMAKRWCRPMAARCRAKPKRLSTPR